MSSSPRHVWVDPTGQWVMGHLPGLLLWWDGQDADGVWWAWCSWAEQGALAHGGRVRLRMERLPASCVRPAVVESPPRDLDHVRPVNEGEVKPEPSSGESEAGG